MIRVGFADLECSSLNADFGIILCGVVKPQGEEPRVFRGDVLNKKWRSKRSDDSAVVKAIIEELAQYDVIAMHNGAKFDHPFLNTRALKWRLPTLGGIKLIDPVLIARKHLRMSWNSLERLADFLGANSKTPVDGAKWQRASLDGDVEAMSEIVEHCIQDVLMLETIVDATKGFCKSFDAKGSWY